MIHNDTKRVSVKANNKQGVCPLVISTHVLKRARAGYGTALFGSSPSHETDIVVPITCDSPGSRVISSAPTFAASTHSIVV